MKLKILIELNGKEYLAGYIEGDDWTNASFSYAEEYAKLDAAIPLSVSLPLEQMEFSPVRTRNYFEGLLPEGFTRRTIAQWVHADENDYLGILSRLGKECIGALKVMDADAATDMSAGYELLSEQQIFALAKEGAAKSAELIVKSHLSLAGASGKVGLYFDGMQSWYLPKGKAPSTHIVKQSHVRLDGIVVNEQLSFLTAKKMKLDVPETFILDTGGRSDAEILFATKRYDRVFGENPLQLDSLRVPMRLHQEDFAQAMGVSASDKYEKAGQNFLHSMFEILRKFSSEPLVDQLKLWDFIIFNYLLGNTDAHLKNFSLLHGKNAHITRLAPAYDLLSTTVYEQSTREMSFSIGGSCLIDEITRHSFEAAASDAGLNRAIALKHFDRLANEFENALSAASQELVKQGFSNASLLREQILKTGGIHNL